MDQRLKGNKLFCFETKTHILVFNCNALILFTFEWPVWSCPTYFRRPTTSATSWTASSIVAVSWNDWKNNIFFNDHLPSYNVQLFQLYLDTVWPDWAIYWTLGKFLKPLAPINLPKSPTFLGIFGKGGKIYRFSSVIIFGQLFRHLAIFFWSPCLDSFCIPTWYGTWSWAYIVDGDGSYWSKWQTVACKIPKLIIYPRNFQVLQL